MEFEDIMYEELWMLYILSESISFGQVDDEMLW